MPKIKIKYYTLIYFFIIFLSSGIVNTICAVFAIILHESGHIFLLNLSGSKINSITLYPQGADIQKKHDLNSYGVDIAVAASGPLLNLITALLLYIPAKNYEVLNVFFIYNIIYAVFNLLPVKGLDGGHVLESFLLLKTENHIADYIMKAAAVLIIIPLWIVSVYLLLFFPENTNPTLFLLCLFLFASVFLN